MQPRKSRWPLRFCLFHVTNSGKEASAGKGGSGQLVRCRCEARTSKQYRQCTASAIIRPAKWARRGLMALEKTRDGARTVLT